MSTSVRTESKHSARDLTFHYKGTKVAEFSLLSSVAPHKPGLEQIKDDTRTGEVEGSKMVLLTVVNRLPRGPSRVRNTLVLLQGDALE